jgi:hypothetical protein
MEKDVYSIITPLLNELNDRSYLVRQKEIARLFENYEDEVIPLLKKMLTKRRGYASGNALEVLAIMGDHRAILAMLRYVEKETGWTGRLFELLKETIKGKSEETKNKINAQFILYLNKGLKAPKTPQPKLFDPVKNQKQLMKVVNALKKTYGIQNLDDSTKKMVDELKEKWGQPPDLSSLTEGEKDEISQHQNIVIEVIDTLRNFNGLNDSRAETVLEGYIKSNHFNSIVTQHALTALALTNPILATLYLNGLTPLQNTQRNITARLVKNKMDASTDSVDFSICVREKNEPKWKEKPYSFKFEQKLVFFLARGEEEYKWLAGRAQNKDEAIQIANKYLKTWIPNIDSMNTKKSYSKKYLGEYTGHNRYQEFSRIFQKHFDFKRWRFQESYISPKRNPVIIYDSELCRVKFWIFVDGNHQYDQRDHMQVYYGRLHASNNEEFINWNDDKCLCWHRIDYALNFLDGLSPEEASKAEFGPRVIEKFRNSGKFSGTSHPVWMAEMHSAIWNHYGQRLFELFDLRRPELWEQYRLFIKEFYKSKDSRLYSNLPANKIC